MTIDTLNDEYFPRGGHAKEIKKKRNFVFEAKGRNEPKAKKPGKRERQRRSGIILNKEENDGVEDGPSFYRFERLTYKRLSVGTVALCSVREVHDKYVDISMPGRLSARLYIVNISQPYQKLLDSGQQTEDGEMAESLERLFRVGQHLACSVLSVSSVEHFSVRLSSDPGVVNSSLSFSSVSVGMVLQFAVESEEDHGHAMYSGIPGLIAFLPRPETPATPFSVQKKILFVGQVVWCLVTKSKLTSSSNTVQLTMDLGKMEDSSLAEGITMEQLLPGVSVHVVITKVVAQTLLVTIDGSEIQGFIEESQLSTPWSQISDYKVGSRLKANVLYKFPYARIIALTLKSGPTSKSKVEIKQGTIFPDAEVMAILVKGVCLKLEHNGKSLKGMVSSRRLGENIDYESLSNRFPIGNHITCRVIGYDALEQVYSCSTQDSVLEEKYLCEADLKVGETVEVTVDSVKKCGLGVSIGMVKGYVPRVHINDVLLQNPLEKVKVKGKYKGKVLKIDRKSVIVTLRPTLVKTASLTRFEDVQVGDGYFGCVRNVGADYIDVNFFGDTFARLTNENLLLPAHKYTSGELVKCYVVQKRFEKSPVFSLSKSVQNMALTVGNRYDLIVKQTETRGLTCFFMSQGQQFSGFLPREHLSDYPEYCKEEMAKYPHGTKILNVLLMSVNDKLPMFTLRRSVLDFYQDFPEICEGLRRLTDRIFIPCSVSELTQEGIMVDAPIPGYNGKILIKAENLPAPVSSYSEYQGLVAKVKKVLPYAKFLELSCRFSDQFRLQFVSSYVVKLLEFLSSREVHRPGKVVKCMVREVGEEAAEVMVLSTRTCGFLLSTSLGTLKVGDTVKATVILHDVPSDTVYLYKEKLDVALPDGGGISLENRVAPGKVVFTGAHFTLVLVNTGEQRHSLAFIPNRTDPNSLQAGGSRETRQFANSHFRLKSLHKRQYDNVSVYYWIATNLVHKKKDYAEDEISPGKSSDSSEMSDKEVTLPVEEIIKSSVKKAKRPAPELTSNEEPQVERKKKYIKIKQTDLAGDKLMEDAARFESTAFPSNRQPQQEDSEEEADEESRGTDRKVGPRERKLAAAEREREIREKEQELLEAEDKPESAEHFDRLLTASPNNSKLWIMYMAHHMQATEIEKARSVAKRALKHINIRLEDERLNVWIASLNLENIYGTPESFKEVLREALKYNDDYKVQERVLDIYADSGKVEELEKLVSQLVKKYRGQVECWLACQGALMKAQLPEKARNYLQRSLESLPNKQYCWLISRFALMENKHGYVEEAQALFENLLTSYPRRIDLWFVYVDMLTKSASVDLARNVLERATSQKLPIRKIKSLYDKWVKLEKTLGTPETVEQVKSAAEGYIRNLKSAIPSNTSDHSD